MSDLVPKRSDVIASKQEITQRTKLWVVALETHRWNVSDETLATFVAETASVPADDFLAAMRLLLHADRVSNPLAEFDACLRTHRRKARLAADDSTPAGGAPLATPAQSRAFLEGIRGTLDRLKASKAAQKRERK